MENNTYNWSSVRLVFDDRVNDNHFEIGYNDFKRNRDDVQGELDYQMLLSHMGNILGTDLESFGINHSTYLTDEIDVSELDIFDSKEEMVEYFKDYIKYLRSDKLTKISFTEFQNLINK
jgi:hypothetical protein|tara:strand:- start:465 stop:821 length:357 start_codon:yes stop_codon:yes gene_type:complete